MTIDKDSKEFKEQKEAIQEKITELVREWQQLEDEDGFVASWLLIAEVVSGGDDGQQSGVSWLTSNGPLSWVRIIGLLRAGSILVEADYLDPPERDDDG